MRSASSSVESVPLGATTFGMRPFDFNWAGEHPLGLLGMIARQFRLLIQVKELKAEGATPGDVAQALWLHPFPVSKLYHQATHSTAAQLEGVHRHLLDTDVAIKSGGIEAEVALDLLVVGLAATGD